MAYIGNTIVELSSAPGTSTSINLAGIPPGSGRMTFRSQHANGAADVFYFMEAGASREWGISTLTHGTPDTLSRDTVLGNHLGTTARINFTGSTYVYNTTPAEKAIYVGADGVVRIGTTGERMSKSATVQLTADASISHATHTAVSWSSAAFDDGAIWSGGAPTRLTVPAGFTRARLVGNVSWAAASGGVRRIGFRKNGAVGIGLGWSQVTTPSAGTGEYQNYATGFIPCVATDYFELYIFQGSGGSLNLYGTGVTETWASIELQR